MERRLVRRCGTIAAIVAVVLSTSQCDNRPVEAPQSALTRTLLSDSPFPYSRVARVDVYVVSVSASLSPDTSSTAAGFAMLATPNRRINLLGLQNGNTDELGAVQVPSGAVTAVRMVIDTDSSSITLKNGTVLTGRTTPGIRWQSSAGRPLLNALILDQILVPDTGATIVIDFDVGRAFIPGYDVTPPIDSNSFVFSPVITAASVARTGTIAGDVRARNASGTPVVDASLRLYLGDPATPENTWSTLATTHSNATGQFRFAYVTASAHWATVPAQAGKVYIVAIDPPAGSGLGRLLVPNVTVTAGAITSLGTLVLP
jgi:uncharacterized protein DUF4382